MTDTTTMSGKIIEAGKVVGSISAILAFAGSIYAIVWGPVQEYKDKVDTVFESHQQVTTSVDLLMSRQDGLVTRQTELQDQLGDILSAVSHNTETQTGLLERVEAMEGAANNRTEPVLRFSRTGHSVSDGQIGGTVSMTWVFQKLFDCGAPIVSVWFQNGGGQRHRFESVSILSSQGVGVNVETDSVMQSLSYTARIPDDQGVEPGRGLGWVVLTYPQCPRVSQVKSPMVPFEILEAE